MANQSDVAAPGGVIVLRRAVMILESFTEQNPELGIADVARRTGLSGSTVHRLVTSLEQHGFLEHVETRGKYRLGLRLVRLGQLALAGVSYAERAADTLAKLAQSTGETVHMGVLRNGLSVYVAKVDGWRSLRLPSQVGKEISPHCTAMGKCLLAFLNEAEAKLVLDKIVFKRHTSRTVVSRTELERQLAEVRTAGYAYDRGELELELSCVGAPVRDYTGQVVAAISISGPSPRVFSDGNSDYVDAALLAAAEISRRLGAN
jgi:DNA-binding IclR family transcriptional regulator